MENFQVVMHNLKHILITADNIYLKQMNYSHTKLNVFDLVFGNLYDLMYKAILDETEVNNNLAIQGLNLFLKCDILK